MTLTLVGGAIILTLWAFSDFGEGGNDLGRNDLDLVKRSVILWERGQ